jgi:hypothetical protein
MLELEDVGARDVGAPGGRSMGSGSAVAMVPVGRGGLPIRWVWGLLFRLIWFGRGRR